jgi:hypothetical protein
MENSKFIAAYTIELDGGLKRYATQMIPIETQKLYNQLVNQLGRIPTETEMNDWITLNNIL